MFERYHKIEKQEKKATLSILKLTGVFKQGAGKGEERSNKSQLMS